MQLCRRIKRSETETVKHWIGYPIKEAKYAIDWGEISSWNRIFTHPIDLKQMIIFCFRKYNIHPSSLCRGISVDTINLTVLKSIFPWCQWWENVFYNVHPVYTFNMLWQKVQVAGVEFNCQLSSLSNDFIALVWISIVCVLLEQQLSEHNAKEWD